MVTYQLVRMQLTRSKTLIALCTFVIYKRNILNAGKPNYFYCAVGMHRIHVRYFKLLPIYRSKVKQNLTRPCVKKQRNL